MQYLPIFSDNPIYNEIYRYNVHNVDDYQNFVNLLKVNLEGDSWALVMNNQIIFNTYEPKSYRSTILDSVIKNHITTRPCILLNEMISTHMDGYINLYMLETNGWCMNINYTVNNSTLSVLYFNTHPPAI